MDVLFDRVAGIDVGKATLTVCVRTPGTGRKRNSETRTFRTMTRSLVVMADWLEECGVTLAAMESTATYWLCAAAHNQYSVQAGVMRSAAGSRPALPAVVADRSMLNAVCCA